MSRITVMRLIVTAILIIFGRTCANAGISARPNVVLIVCDDLNDYVTDMGGHPQASTPNLARLAESGVAFRRAYSNNPVCAPSRSSFLTGILPQTSGNLFFDKWYQNPVLKNSRTLMEYFRANGYHVAGSGKVMHHHQRSLWSEYKHEADYGPFAYNGKKKVPHPSVPSPFSSLGAVIGSFAPLSDVPFKGSGNPDAGWVYTVSQEGTWEKTTKPLHYTDENDRDPTPDERNAQWAADRIKAFDESNSDQPLFLAVGFIRPHTPLIAPKKFFDQYPLESVQVPVRKENDQSDTHYREAVGKKEPKGMKHFRLLKASYPELEDGLKAFTQAYLACIAAADECVGQVVDAVDRSSMKDNTIIVFVSDHGWHMGEKDYIAKNTLWEESCRVPLIIRAPGVTDAGKVADHPVSLIDLYPTLVDLCGLTGDTRKNNKGAKLDGFSLRPFLEHPATKIWDGPEAALSMSYAGPDSKNRIDQQHYAVRTERWRYIRYNTGGEELYDHDNDSNEWTNLANSPEHAAIKAALYKTMQNMIAQ